MKKLEKLLEKLIGDKRIGDILTNLLGIAFLLLYMVLGILFATDGYYLLLSAMIFTCVCLLSSFFSKVFLKKIDNYLRKTPKATTLIFIIACGITIILSWSHFIGVIISAILAFILADYIKTIRNSRN